MVFYFKVIDDSLTGSIESQRGGSEITNGKIDGTSFSFDIERCGRQIYHHCTFEGDSIIMLMLGRDGQERKMIL